MFLFSFDLVCSSFAQLSESGTDSSVAVHPAVCLGGWIDTEEPVSVDKRRLGLGELSRRRKFKGQCMFVRECLCWSDAECCSEFNAVLMWPCGAITVTPSDDPAPRLFRASLFVLTTIEFVFFTFIVPNCKSAFNDL